LVGWLVGFFFRSLLAGRSVIHSFSYLDEVRVDRNFEGV